MFVGPSFSFFEDNNVILGTARKMDFNISKDYLDHQCTIVKNI